MTAGEMGEILNAFLSKNPNNANVEAVAAAEGQAFYGPDEIMECCEIDVAMQNLQIVEIVPPKGKNKQLTIIAKHLKEAK